MSLKDLPSPNAPNFPLRVREMLHTMLGKTGSADERLLTLREAVASGVVKPGPGGSLVPGDAISGGTGGDAYVPDLTPPPAPDTLTANPAISHILLEVPAATYTQGHGHLRTRVYGVARLSGDPAPVFADAVEVGQFSGTVWAFPSNPSTTWHFWAKWESVDGVLSATPVGGTNGVAATTGQDVSSLLDALAGQISTSELATSLATRIDLIDGTGPGSVAQRIADEATARAAAILAETNARNAADTGLQDQINLLAASAGGDLSDLLDAVNQERTDRIADVLDAENAAAAADALLNSALVAEALARSGADSDLAVQASAIAAATAGNAAAVVQAQQASATETGALASATAALASASAGNAASVRTEEQARTDADSAQSARLQAVSASAADSAAAVRTEQTTRATDDSALAAQSVVLAAKTADNTAGLVQEAAVRSTADSAAAAVSAGILSQAQGAASAISVEQAVSAAADAALAAQSAVQVSQLGAQAAAIQLETLTRATDDAALSQRATLLSAQAGEQAAAIRSEAATRADADTAQALQTQAVSAAAGQGLAAVRTEESARVTADTAQAATSSALAASLAGNVAAIVTEQAVRTTEGTSLAQRVDALAVTAAGSAAAISTQQQVSADQDNALALQVAILGTSVGNNSVSIQTESATRASETGSLFAKYTVKVDVAGHVSGYGLASTANNGAVVSQFGIRADQFFIAPPATSSATAPTTNLYKGMVWVDTSVTPNVTRYYTGSSWSATPQALPFVVQTTPTTINGETVPPGVYIDNAYMALLVATRGQIGLLAVDDARIANLSVSKLTAGSIAVGQYAQSTGYVAGSSGWRINGDGTAEFSGVVVRGTVFASQGAIGGWTIGSNYLQSTTYALGTSGTRFNSDGTGQIGGITIYSQGLGVGSTAYDTGNGAWIGRDGKLSLKSAINSLKWDGWTLQIVGGGTFSGALSAATGTFAGSLSAATGSFAGSLNAATGTFSGSLTASAVNAVNTINLAGNAVTVPVGVSASNLFTTSTSGYIILSASITTNGEPVIVQGTLNGDVSTGSVTGPEARILLRRNGTVLTSAIFTNGSEISVPLTALDYPPTGTHTYDLQYTWSKVGGSANISLTGRSRSIVLLSAKR